MNERLNTSETEFEEFLKLEKTAPIAELNALSKRISTELVASRLRLAVLYGVFSVVGYIVTLAVCSQGGVGLFGLSDRNSAVLMQTLPAPWCSVVCGAIFSGIPFMFSVLLMNRFQRRFLIFKMFWLPLLMSAIGCLALLFAGHSFGEVQLQNLDVAWILSAIATPYVAESTLSAALAQKRVKE